MNHNEIPGRPDRFTGRAADDRAYVRDHQAERIEHLEREGLRKDQRITALIEQIDALKRRPIATVAKLKRDNIEEGEEPRIVTALREFGEMTVGELAKSMGIESSSVSWYVNKYSGLLIRRREGQHVYLSLMQED